MKLTTAEHDEAFHDGMEAAYANLAELLDRLHGAGMHLSLQGSGSEFWAAVQGTEQLPVNGFLNSSFSAGRIDELLGMVEDWCNEWLPTGHEVTP